MSTPQPAETTSLEARIAEQVAGLSFETENARKWDEVTATAAEALGLSPDKVRAIGVVEASTVDSRLTSIGVIKASPDLFLVFSKLPSEQILPRIRALIPLTKHLRTIVVFVDGPQWRADHIIDVAPKGIGPAVKAHFMGAAHERLDEAGRLIGLAAPPLPKSWIILHRGDGSYHNIDGVRYRYTRSIPNGTQLGVGHLVFCYRTQTSTNDDAGTLFGVGRVGRLIQRGTGADLGQEVYYDRFAFVPPLPLAEVGDPRNNPTNSIVSAPPEWADQVLRRWGYSSADDLPASLRALTYDHVSAELSRSNLFVPRATIEEALASIRAGKHLMLTGPPGTGKTTLGEILARAAHAAGLNDGWLLSTATADWTSADTVGAYRLRRDGRLYFSAGQMLEAVEENRWLVIDELNRSDMDKAIGQFFTVLSGQAVVTPFMEERDGIEYPVAIVPHGANAPEDVRAYSIADTWRLVATMNEKDKDLLFDLSEALLRRFAILKVDVPDASTWQQILDARAQTGDEIFDAAIGRLVLTAPKPLGPAIVLDLARHLTEQRILHEEAGRVINHSEILGRAFSIYISPHYYDLTSQQKEAAERWLFGLSSGQPPEAAVEDGVESGEGYIVGEQL